MFSPEIETTNKNIGIIMKRIRVSRVEEHNTKKKKNYQGNSSAYLTRLKKKKKSVNQKICKLILTSLKNIKEEESKGKNIKKEMNRTGLQRHVGCHLAYQYTKKGISEKR